MATQPHHTQADTEHTAPPPPPSAPPSPGGMASDPSIALANQIVTSIKGAMDKARQESTDAVMGNLVGEVAASIRSFMSNEMSKGQALKG